MADDQNSILEDVANYYTGKLSEHGVTPRGVDWNSEESQLLRFDQLLKVVDEPSGYSINDLGCGYGALYDHLTEKRQGFHYFGCDVSSAMIEAAKTTYANNSNAQFYVSAKLKMQADYSVASGIFNVRLNHNDNEWWEHITTTLDDLNSESKRGFAFNCLTSYSDSEKKRGYLYYADPCALFALCKLHYSRHVALLHDYGLYEFTIIVKK